jgi:Photosynthesis system II assembly factor YCF48
MAAREEDKAMAGLLRRSLAQDAGAGSGENCPEPEIIAAYFDHALDADETVRYDLHFSRCSICREQLAAMARADGVDGTAAAAKKTAGAWAWLTGAGWLMPAAATLVVLLAITGIALRMRKPPLAATEVAMSRPDAVPPANAAPAANSAPLPEAAISSGVESSAPRAERSGSAGSPAAPGESAASRELGARLPSHTVAHANSAPRTRELSRVGVVGGLAGNSAAAPVMQPMAPKPAPQSSPVMVRGAMQAGNGVGASSGSGGGVVGGTVNSADETVTVMQAAPPVDAAEPARVAPEKKAEAYSAKRDAAVTVEAAPQPNARKTRSSASSSGAGSAGAATPVPAAKAMNLEASQTTEAAALAKMQQAQISSNLMNLQIQTPDPKILWMIASAGAVEKSEDGGASWKTEYLDTRGPILAGAAPSAKICWLVGQNATILRTTNGARWKTINPPAETDLVRVEANDALTATVSALDGRRFSTSDGGKSWKSVK